jgi:xylan 1,4-beta-xylosidase
VLQVLSVLPQGEGRSVLSMPVDVPDGPLALRVDVDEEAMRFGFRAEDGADWQWLAETFDASLLSDEATLSGLPNFTGGFVGIACQDMSGSGMPADFRYFRYTERDG